MAVDIDYREYFLPETIQELRRAHERYDISGDGVISIRELYQMFRTLGKKVSKTQLQHVLAEIDSDGNGNIDFEELCILEIKMSGARPRADLIDYREYLTERQIAKLESIFLRYDRKNTGLIGLETFCAIVESMAPWTEKTPLEKRATRNDYEDVLAEVDPGCTGSINFHQLCAGFAVLTKARKAINYREYLQQDEVVEYRRIFKHTTERKGQSGLMKSDLDKILRRMGAQLSKAQLKEFFEYFDTDGSGLMDLAEFCAMIVRVRGLQRFREIRPEICDARELWREEKFTVEELQQSGFVLADLKMAGVPIALLHQGGYTALELRKAGFSARELKQGGVPLMDLRSGGFSLMDLRLAGFSHEALEGINRQLLGSFSTGDLSVLPRMAPKAVVAKHFALSSAGFLVMKGMKGLNAGAVVPLPPLQRQMTPMIREHTDWRSPYAEVGAPPVNEWTGKLARTRSCKGFLLDANGRFKG